MFFFPIAHIIFSAILTGFSVFIFTGIDEVQYKPEKLARTSDTVSNYFIAELVLSSILTLTSLFSHSKIVCFISFPLTIYNYYCLYKKNYKLYFSIGEEHQNRRNYNSQSFRYKVKFVIYLIITIISFVAFLINLFYYLLQKVLNNPEGVASILKFFGILDRSE